MRIMPRDETERLEQRKAARLALDTSAHASLEYQKILKQCSSPVRPPAKTLKKRDGGLLVLSDGSYCIKLDFQAWNLAAVSKFKALLLCKQRSEA